MYRRHLFKGLLAVSCAGLAATVRSVAGNNNGNNGNHYGNGNGNGRGNGGAGCVLKGTMILTVTGQRPVEELKIGDELVTLSGSKQIKWIGYDKFRKEKDRRWIDSVMPIKVARFAINDESPHEDLYLSPWHCIYLNDSLIPAKYLVNVRAISHRAPDDTSVLEYYNIDLGAHEIIYANGARIESYLDSGRSRESYSNFAQYTRLYGAEPPKMRPFAPILGPVNRAERMTRRVRTLVGGVAPSLRDPIQIARDQLAKRAKDLCV